MKFLKSKIAEKKFEEIMKKFIYIVLILLIATSIFSDANVDSIFQSAISSYENKDFDVALKQFLSLENESIINADLFYNIGNCYFRLNNIGKAILYFERTLKIEPLHQAANRNLNLALTLTKDKQKKEKLDAFSDFIKKIYKMVSINSLSIINLSLFILIIVILNIMILFYRNRDKSAPIFIFTILILLFAIVSTTGYMKWNSYSHSTKSVLMHGTAVGYSGPGEDFTRVFTIHEGHIFEVVKEESGWSQIKLQNGLGGWIRNDSFEKI